MTAGAKNWRWRQMTAGDLARVVELAAQLHPDYPEDAAVFAERLGLFPEGCLALDCDGEVQGYLLSHPWTSATPPALNALLGTLPTFPSIYYLHDLALDPSARGTGAARAVVDRVDAIAAAAGFNRVGLVAINGAERFWGSCGFEATSDKALLDAARRYDDGALYMTRAVAGAMQGGEIATNKAVTGSTASGDAAAGDD